LTFLVVVDAHAPARRGPVAAVALLHPPLVFEPSESGRLVARGRGATVWLGEEGATVAVAGAAFRMRAVGARARRPELLERMPGVSNYLIGADPARWRSRVPRFARARVQGAYPGVDLVYYGNDGHLEYDFVVAPGADAQPIRVAFEGVDHLRVDADGDLVLTVAGREVVQRRPLVYQEIGGRRRELGAAYVITGPMEVAFRVAPHDRGRALVIDPVLTYSALIGGTGKDTSAAIAVDGQGSVYIAGTTASTDFPATTGALQTINHAQSGNRNAFVMKVGFDGATVYATYLGGSFDDTGAGIAVDAQGSAYVTGNALSSDFPLKNAFQSAAHTYADAFIAKLAPAGDDLVYSSLIGGSNGSTAVAVAVDSAGAAYVTGRAFPPDFPTTNGAADTTPGTLEDAFLVKVAPGAGSVVYATLIGGTADDIPTGVAVDQAGAAYVTGETSSADLPTTSGALQSTLPSGTGIHAFVAKVAPDGGSFSYLTYLGGSAGDKANGIAVSSSGTACITGFTNSSDFPVTGGAAQTTYVGGQASSGFITQLTPSGAMGYSTFFGGTGPVSPRSVGMDGSGNCYVAGATSATDMPLSNAIQLSNSGGANDMFVAKLAASGAGFLYSTYLGGTGDDAATGIAVDPGGTAYIVGTSTSSSIPGSGVRQPSSRTDSDIVVAKVSTPSVLTLGFITPRSGPPSGGNSVTLSGDHFPSSPVVAFGAQTVDITSSSATEIVVQAPPGSGSVDVRVANQAGDQSSTLTEGYTYVEPPGPTPAPTIDAISNPGGYTTGGYDLSLTGTGFIDGATVTMGGVAGSRVSVTSSTQITFTAPAHDPGVVDVVLTNPDSQSAALANAFEYVQPKPTGCGMGAGPWALAAFAFAWLAWSRRRHGATHVKGA
jgi:hypothetical protein